MAVNKSKVRESRFQKRWSDSGALGSVIHVRLPIVLTLVTGKVMERGLSSVGNAEVDEVFYFFIDRISISLPEVGDRPDRLLVREMMIAKYPQLKDIALPADFSETTLRAWLSEQEKLLGGKSLIFSGRVLNREACLAAWRKKHGL